MKVALPNKDIDDIGAICGASETERRTLGKVTELDLSHNQISSCLRAFVAGGKMPSTETDEHQPGSSSSVFIPLKSLQKLLLPHNKLYPDLRGIEELAATLTHLDVSYNRLTSLSGLKRCSQLVHIDAAHNNIQSLEGLPNMIRYHSLAPTAEAADAVLPSNGSAAHPLLTLKLSHNRIPTKSLQYLSTKLGPSLVAIDLSHNLIESLQALADTFGDVQCFSHLATLDVSYNPCLVNGSTGYGEAKAFLSEACGHVGTIEASHSNAAQRYSQPLSANASSVMVVVADTNTSSRSVNRRSSSVGAGEASYSALAKKGPSVERLGSSRQPEDAPVSTKSVMTAEVPATSSFNTLARAAIPAMLQNDQELVRLRKEVSQKSRVISDNVATIRQQREELGSLREEVAALKQALRQRTAEAEAAREGARVAEANRQALAVRSQVREFATENPFTQHKTYSRSTRNASYIDNFGNRRHSHEHHHMPKVGDYNHAHASYTYPEDTSVDSVDQALVAKHNLNHMNLPVGQITATEQYSQGSRVLYPKARQMSSGTPPPSSQNKRETALAAEANAALRSLVNEQSQYIDDMVNENARLMGLLQRVVEEQSMLRSREDTTHDEDDDSAAVRRDGYEVPSSPEQPHFTSTSGPREASTSIDSDVPIAEYVRRRAHSTRKRKGTHQEF